MSAPSLDQLLYDSLTTGKCPLVASDVYDKGGRLGTLSSAELQSVADVLFSYSSGGASSQNTMLEKVFENDTPTIDNIVQNVTDRGIRFYDDTLVLDFINNVSSRLDLGEILARAAEFSSLTQNLVNHQQCVDVVSKCVNSGADVNYNDGEAVRYAGNAKFKNMMSFMLNNGLTGDTSGAKDSVGKAVAKGWLSEAQTLVTRVY